MARPLLVVYTVFALFLTSSGLAERPVRPENEPYFCGKNRYSRDLLIRLNSWECGEMNHAAFQMAYHKDNIAPEVLVHASRGKFGLPGPTIYYLADYGGKEGLEFVHKVLKTASYADQKRGKAAMALGRKRYYKALPDIVDALHATSWRLRAPAARALGVFGDGRVRRDLKDRFRIERDCRVLPEIALALYRLGDEKGLSYLIARFRSGRGTPMTKPLVRSILTTIVSEWPRYQRIAKEDAIGQQRMIENWIYEWEKGLLPKNPVPELLGRRRAHSGGGSCQHRVRLQ